MGCIIVANKEIGDVHVNGEKARSGPGLAQYLHWRGASLMWVISLLLVKIILQVASTAGTLVLGSRILPPMMLEPMKVVLFMLCAASILIAIASCLGLCFLVLAFLIRRRHFRRSWTLVRQAYFLEMIVPMAVYLAFPFAWFFRSRRVMQHVCTFTIYHMMRMGPVIRQALAMAAAMGGEGQLAVAAQAPLPHDYSEAENWAGDLWCRSKEDWIVTVFGPSPNMPRLAFQPISIGLVPNIINFLEGMTGARCKTPGLARIGANPGGNSFLQEFVQHQTSAASDGASDGKRSSPGEKSKKHSGSPMKDALQRLHLSNKEFEQLKTLAHAVWPGGQASEGLSDGTAQILKLLVNVTVAAAQRSHAEHFMGASLRAQLGSSLSCRVGLDANCTPIAAAVLAQASEESSFSILGAQTLVCQFASAMSVMADAARVAVLLLTQFAGSYCAVAALKHSFPPLFSVMKGYRKAALNVKTMLPMETLPGYLLFVGSGMYIPALVISLISYSQLGANICFSLGLGCLFFALVQDLLMGQLLMHHFSYEKLWEHVSPILKRQKLLLFASFVLVLITVCFWIYVFSEEGYTERLLDVGKEFTFVTLLGMLVNFLLGRSFSRLVFTDYMLDILFDVRDDEMKVKNDSGQMDALSMLKEWYTLLHDTDAMERLESSDEYKVSQERASQQTEEQEHHEVENEDDEEEDEEDEDDDMPPLGARPPPPR